jgi:hypothetical protein
MNDECNECFEQIELLKKLIKQYRKETDEAEKKVLQGNAKRRRALESKVS